jgi:hypothetical protein
VLPTHPTGELSSTQEPHLDAVATKSIRRSLTSFSASLLERLLTSSTVALLSSFSSSYEHAQLPAEGNATGTKLSPGVWGVTGVDLVCVVALNKLLVVVDRDMEYGRQIVAIADFLLT